MTNSNERRTTPYIRRAKKSIHNELQPLTPSETAVAAGFVRLVIAGVPPSPQALSSLITDDDGKSKYTEQSIGFMMSSLGNKLPRTPGQISDLLGDKAEWPNRMPIQTFGDLGDVFLYYGERKRQQNMAKRLPDKVREWMEDNHNPNAFPHLNPKAKKSDLSSLELVETDLVIAKRLLAMDPVNGYQYSEPLDIVPELQNLDAFKNIDSKYIEGYVSNGVFMIPKRYKPAANIKQDALQKGEEDPTKEMRVGKLIRMVEQTQITPDLTLTGVSQRNLYLILSRSLTFEEMQRRIVAAQ